MSNHHELKHSGNSILRSSSGYDICRKPQSCLQRPANQKNSVSLDKLFSPRRHYLRFLKPGEISDGRHTDLLKDLNHAVNETTPSLPGTPTNSDSKISINKIITNESGNDLKLISESSCLRNEKQGLSEAKPAAGYKLGANTRGSEFEEIRDQEGISQKFAEQNASNNQRKVELSASRSEKDSVSGEIMIKATENEDNIEPMISSDKGKLSLQRFPERYYHETKNKELINERISDTPSRFEMDQIILNSNDSLESGNFKSVIAQKYTVGTKNDEKFVLHPLKNSQEVPRNGDFLNEDNITARQIENSSVKEDETDINLNIVNNQNNEIYKFSEASVSKLPGCSLETAASEPYSERSLKIQEVKSLKDKSSTEKKFDICHKIKMCAETFKKQLLEMKNRAKSPEDIQFLIDAVNDISGMKNDLSRHSKSLDSKIIELTKQGISSKILGSSLQSQQKQSQMQCSECVDQKDAMLDLNSNENNDLFDARGKLSPQFKKYKRKRSCSPTETYSECNSECKSPKANEPNSNRKKNNPAEPSNKVSMHHTPHQTNMETCKLKRNSCIFSPASDRNRKRSLQTQKAYLSSKEKETETKRMKSLLHRQLCLIHNHVAKRNDETKYTNRNDDKLNNTNTAKIIEAEGIHSDLFTVEVSSLEDMESFLLFLRKRKENVSFPVGTKHRNYRQTNQLGSNSPERINLERNPADLELHLKKDLCNIDPKNLTDRQVNKITNVLSNISKSEGQNVITNKTCLKNYQQTSQKKQPLIKIKDLDEAREVYTSENRKITRTRENLVQDTNQTLKLALNQDFDISKDLVLNESILSTSGNKSNKGMIKSLSADKHIDEGLFQINDERFVEKSIKELDTEKNKFTAFDGELYVKTKRNEFELKKEKLVTKRMPDLCKTESERNLFETSTENLNAKRSRNEEATLEKMEAFLQQLREKKMERMKYMENCSLHAVSEPKEESFSKQNGSKRKAVFMAHAEKEKNSEILKGSKKAKSVPEYSYLFDFEYNKALQKIMAETKAISTDYRSTKNEHTHATGHDSGKREEINLIKTNEEDNKKGKATEEGKLTFKFKNSILNGENASEDIKYLDNKKRQALLSAKSQKLFNAFRAKMKMKKLVQNLRNNN